MVKKRLELGFAKYTEDLSCVKPKEARLNMPMNSIMAAADNEGFDRNAPSKLRRRRTGRNVQINIKARQDTIDAFYKLADERGWGLGETFEYAVEYLKNAPRDGKS